MEKQPFFRAFLRGNTAWAATAGLGFKGLNTFMFWYSFGDTLKHIS